MRTSHAPPPAPACPGPRFEYAPQHEAEFEEMVKQLRASDEWRYVEREVDIRLERVVAAAG